MRSFRITLFVAVLLVTWIISIPANAESQSPTNPTWIAGPNNDPEKPSTYLIRSDADLPIRRVITDEIRAIADQITEMKTQGLYNQSLWDQYFDALYPDRTHAPSGLDQGGDDCSTASIINTLPFSASGTTAAYNDDYDYSGGFFCPWPSNSPDVVYQYTPVTNEFVNISLCNSYYDSKLIVYQDGCDSVNTYACDDDGCGVLQGYTSQINELDLITGHTYYIVVDGYGGDAGDYTIEIDYALPRPVNDNCADAILIPCDTTNVYVDLTNATTECVFHEGPEVWYKFSLDPAISQYWNVSVSYCDTDPNIIGVGANLQSDCECGNPLGYSGISGTVCLSPPGFPEWIYFDGVPAGDWYLPVYTDLSTYVVFDLDCQPADCPEIDCVGIPELPNDGGCWEPPYESQIIDCGTTICGTLNADPLVRNWDTDYFQTTVLEPTIFTWHVEHDSPLDVWISVLDMACNELYFADNGFCQETIVTAPLPPGTYYFYVAHHLPTGVPVPVDYAATLTCVPGDLIPCPNPEIEPNGGLPVVQSITLGDTMCGLITSQHDIDMVNLLMPQETAVQITLNGYGSLHPCVMILSEAGEIIAFAGDTANVANEFTTDFKLGQGAYVLSICGVSGTSGQYELWVDAIVSPTVAPPDPVVTIQKVGDIVELQWYGSYFADEIIQIERSEFPEGPFNVIMQISGDATNWYDTNPPTFGAFYQVTAIGERDPDPFLGSTITLSELEGAGPDVEMLDLVIQEIEWAVDDSNRIAMSYVLAQGVPPDDDTWISSDLRNLYGNGLTPIRSFNDHILTVGDQEILLDHIAFAQDDSGECRIIDGFGTDPKSDTTYHFSEFTKILPCNSDVACADWGFGGFPWPFGFACPENKCCRLKVVAICDGPAWARFPCPPPQRACELRPAAFGPTWMVWCICPNQPAPPPRSGPCFFKIWVKCKYYPCFPQPPCWCVGAPPCPWPNRWVQVSNTGGMRAQCKRWCAGPGF